MFWKFIMVCLCCGSVLVHCARLSISPFNLEIYGLPFKEIFLGYFIFFLSFLKLASSRLKWIKGKERSREGRRAEGRDEGRGEGRGGKSKESKQGEWWQQWMGWWKDKRNNDTLFLVSIFFLSLKIKFFTVSQKVREKENWETVLFYEPKMEENPSQKQ